MRNGLGIALVLTLAASLGAATVSHASSEGDCALARHKALAKYEKCQHDTFGKEAAGDPYTQKRAEKCVLNYVKVWTKLQSKFAGTGASCDQPRYADNGDGTITDRLTSLQWEQKTNGDTVIVPADPHDADNEYTWSASGGPPDGTVFTSFFATLNGGACFTGQCDWRVPTIVELYTIGLVGIDCARDTCVDPALTPNGYLSWSASIRGASHPWALNFNGSTYLASGTPSNPWPVRAVRAGLR
jgi:Protein of unknown function (DUF1566)